MPDSRRIVYSSTSADRGPLNLWWQAVDGTGSAERLTTSGNNQWSTSVSSDGMQVVFSELTPPPMGRDLLRLTLDGTRRVTPLLQTSFNEQNGVVSPDGHWLAYESDSTGRFEIFVRPFPNATAGWSQVSTTGGRHPVWAGKELFFFGADGALMRVPVEATATNWNAGSPTKLLEPGYYTGSGNPNRSYDVSPDGRRFLMIKAGGADGTSAPPSLTIVQHFDEELKRLVPVTR
jgi:serine/threonine-protein kinase